MTVALEIRDFYVREGLPEHGGQEGFIDWTTAFGMPAPIPNVAARKKVLVFHDAHHLVTGFTTDEIGEAEVGAWALGAGDGSLLALGYDQAAMALGFVQAPRRVAAAFFWGRQCKSLYRLDPDELLAMTLDELKTEALVDRPKRVRLATDNLAFAAHVFAALVSPVLLPLFLLLGVLGF